MPTQATEVLAPTLAPLVHPHVINQEMIVEAGLRGDKDLAFQTFLNDPLISHHPESRSMFEAEGEYLPQFGESSGLRASYR